MAFPVLFRDDAVGEPACTGCMACVNYCPTECMSASVDRNPKFLSGESPRKTVARAFQIDYSKCIECGICVDVCDYEAIGLGIESAPDDIRVVDLEWLEGNGRELKARVGHRAAVQKPDVSKLLDAVRHKLPPASTSDGARRAWSRLRSTSPVDVRVDRSDDSPASERAR